ncbi:MAG: hypothetical protein ACLFM8_07535 [Halobacteriales archaeon]
MIVVATADFELYHDLVWELRRRDLEFTTVEPGDPLPPGTTAVLTGATDETPPSAAEITTVVSRSEEARAAVDAALAGGSDDDARVVVGVDPGERPGIAVLEDDLVVAAFQVPLEAAVSVIEAEVDGAPDAVVRVGDGSRLRSARLVNALEGVRVELVDETGTTPHLGAGATAVGDVLAAVNIARREGAVVEHRDLEPSTGELTAIKARARDRSRTNRAIDGELARRVALGELSLEEALEVHAEE